MVCRFCAVIHPKFTENVPNVKSNCSFFDCKRQCDLTIFAPASD